MVNGSDILVLQPGASAAQERAARRAVTSERIPLFGQEYDEEGKHRVWDVRDGSWTLPMTLKMAERQLRKTGVMCDSCGWHDLTSRDAQRHVGRCDRAQLRIFVLFTRQPSEPPAPLATTGRNSGGHDTGSRVNTAASPPAKSQRRGGRKRRRRRGRGGAHAGHGR